MPTAQRRWRLPLDRVDVGVPLRCVRRIGRRKRRRGRGGRSITISVVHVDGHARPSRSRLYGTPTSGQPVRVRSTRAALRLTGVPEGRRSCWPRKAGGPVLDVTDHDIIITDRDRDRLAPVLDQSDSPASELLQTELLRAVIVDVHDVPPDVVTMNSEVVYEDCATGARRTVHVVYPKDADASHGRVSVLCRSAARCSVCASGSPSTGGYPAASGASASSRCAISRRRLAIRADHPAVWLPRTTASQPFVVTRRLARVRGAQTGWLNAWTIDAMPVGSSAVAGASSRPRRRWSAPRHWSRAPPAPPCPRPPRSAGRGSAGAARRGRRR